MRIEKTLEVLDVSFGEEEKTLSISSVSKDRDDETDVEDEDIEVLQFCDKPRLIITDSERLFKSKDYYFHLFSRSNQEITPGSLSESDETQPGPAVTARNSRCVEKVRNRRYEATQVRETFSILYFIVVLQSMDRANTDRSPVFYLEPIDWIRTGLSYYQCQCRL